MNFEEYCEKSGITSGTDAKRFTRVGWDARQPEIDELKAKLRPYLLEEFLDTRAKFITKILFPYKTINQDFIHPEAFTHGGFDDIQYLNFFENGQAKISWSYWCTDHTNHDEFTFPAEWIDFDNQISEDDLFIIMKEWCKELKIKLEEEKAEKTKKANLERVARLEKELLEAKGKL